MLDYRTVASAHPVIAAPTSHQQWRDLVRELSLRELSCFELHLLRLNDTCRRSRFGATASDTFLRQYATAIDESSAVVLGCFIGGEMRGAVELRSLQSGWGSKAEVAFSVEREWQGRGIGTALMAAAIEAARERGLDHLYLSFHAFNRGMARIAEKVAADVDCSDGECFADVRVRLEPIAPELAESRDVPGLMDSIVVIDV